MGPIAANTDYAELVTEEQANGMPGIHTERDTGVAF